MGIRNMAKKRGPREVVAVQMALPTAARSIRPMMCRDRSPNRADVQVTQIETNRVANYPKGNAVSKDVISTTETKQSRGTYPDRSREPQRHDAPVSQRAHDGGEEVLERLREQADVLEQDEDV